MATVEIDGKTFEVENGKMIIEVADEAGIPIPRFCYHKKLSVAANCRMCLVEIENSKKTVPACATPISNGMKVFTKSAAALKSQQAVMEFLLINHPLDCPICDQGGECELQDVSMGYGEDHSDFGEHKRSVNSQNLGPLIETEMTRCIHCTRCVRFGEEIAGLRELGAPFRGEDVKIGTYVETSIRSEVSGNIIDLCPVGALTSKPYRYTARSWELEQKESVAPHDCLGSNVHVHTRRGKLMRVIPKDCESINETWISDRDRFSYTGLYSEKRLGHPMVKQNGEWKAVDWSIALNLVASRLGEVLAHHGPENVAAFASPSASVEELYILQKWFRQLKVNNLDHRLRQQDFSLDALGCGFAQNNLDYAELDDQKSIFLLGTHLHREVPLAATRVRKAYLNGARIASLNVSDYQSPFSVELAIKAEPFAFEYHLLAIMNALKLDLSNVPEDFKKLIKDIKLDDKHLAIAQMLEDEKSVIITGAMFENHPRFSQLKACLDWLTSQTTIKWIHLPQGANSLGAWAAGFVPHLGPKGLSLEQKGRAVADCLDDKLKAVILHGVEPSHDFSKGQHAKKAIMNAEFVVAVTSFDTDDLREVADVMLPMAAFSETSGTIVNLNNNWQSFEGAARPYEQSRPAWKIYRVLANLSHAAGFDYVSSKEILDELQALQQHEYVSAQSALPTELLESTQDLIGVSEVALYGVDMLVRHAIPLQDSAAADTNKIVLHPKLAEKHSLNDKVTVSCNNNEITLPLELDDRLTENVVLLPSAGCYENILGAMCGKVSIN